MEKHFHVLFKSEMIYGMSRLCGVQCGNEKLMKSSFKGCETAQLIYAYIYILKGVMSWGMRRKVPMT